MRVVILASLRGAIQRGEEKGAEMTHDGDPLALLSSGVGTGENKERNFRNDRRMLAPFGSGLVRRWRRGEDGMHKKEGENSTCTTLPFQGQPNTFLYSRGIALPSEGLIPIRKGVHEVTINARRWGPGRTKC
jgi:hypothetical protein